MATSGVSDQHIEAAKRRLVHLSGLSGRVARAELAIENAAARQLRTVLADLDSLRPRVNLDDAAADRYQVLTTERGRLEQVIANCQRHWS